MDLIVALLLLFVTARLAGEAFERMRQSPLIGEVLAGILLGPMLLGLIDPDPTTELGASLSVAANLGILVLVLLAGIELGREGLHQAFRERSMVVAMVEFFLPFVAGYAFGLSIGMTFAQALFLGTALSVTALPVSVRILLDLNLLHSRLGRAIVSVALVNDLVAFAMLGLVLELTRIGGVVDGSTVALVLAKNLIFLGLVYSVSLVLKESSRITRSGQTYMQTFLGKLRGQESGFAVAVAIALALGAGAELLGIHFAVGVFYGGILITPRLMGRERFAKIRNAVSSVAFGFFTPIFFAFVGLNFAVALGAWPLVVTVTAIAFLGKVLGGILGGYVARFRGAPLLALGFGLNARGMMELLLAQVGLAAGIIGADLYSALIVMTLVTTLSTPIALKRLVRRFKASDVIPVAHEAPSEAPPDAEPTGGPVSGIREPGSGGV